MNKPMKEQLQQAFKDYWAEQEKYKKKKKRNKKKIKVKVKKMERPKPKERKDENLSDHDLRELMGVNRPTYSRHKGGAYRQK